MLVTIFHDFWPSQHFYYDNQTFIVDKRVNTRWVYRKGKEKSSGLFFHVLCTYVWPFSMLQKQHNSWRNRHTLTQLLSNKQAIITTANKAATAVFGTSISFLFLGNEPHKNYFFLRLHLWLSIETSLTYTILVLNKMAKATSFQRQKWYHKMYWTFDNIFWHTFFHTLSPGMSHFL